MTAEFKSTRTGLDSQHGLIAALEAGVTMRRAQEDHFLRQSRQTHDAKKAAEFAFDRLAAEALNLRKHGDEVQT